MITVDYSKLATDKASVGTSYRVREMDNRYCEVQASFNRVRNLHKGGPLVERDKVLVASSSCEDNHTLS